MIQKIVKFCIILTLFNLSQAEEQQNNHENKQNHTAKILSRKRRYLIFPTGSSVSIATCMTVGVYGNPQFSLWSWAVNYGFAYNLPTNSTDYLHPPEDVFTFPFYNPEDSTTTTTTTEEPTTIFYHSHDSHESFHSHDSHESHADHETSSNMASRRKYSVYRQPPKFETQPMIHRRYRRDMYRNIEAVIDKMGYNGRDCVLQALCESSMMFKKKRRTMIQEMIKTVFTMPKSKVLPFEHPELLIYDEAYRNGLKEVDCESSYTKCNFSLIKLILGKYSSPFTGFM